MTKELKEQIHERIYNLKVPTLGFSRQDLFNIAMEYVEPREKRIADLEAQIEEMKCCYNCKHSRTEYEHCKTGKHEKWEIKEK